MSPALLAALKVLVLAGGGEADENYHSHAVHVRELLSAAEARGVDRDDITVFWADGTDPGPDRAVSVPQDAVRDDWLLMGTPLDEATAVGPRLEDTRFPGFRVRPAKRKALRAWLAREGKRLGPGDTLLIAVTDHGQPDPEGGWNSRISLWGETWSARELLADLRPVSEDVRVLLWMSQCFGGGFAELHAEREGLCGAFAAAPDRPSYGCFPELATQEKVGHFQRFVAAIRRADTLVGATSETMLTDDTPDTPHVTSDAWMFAVLAEEAERRGEEVGPLIDRLLVGAPADAPERLLIRAVAERYGLGAVANYADVEHALDTVEAARFALRAWDERWEIVSDRDRVHLASSVEVELASGASRDARIQARKGLVRQLKSALVHRPSLDARVAGVHRRRERARELRRQLDLQEAAALRIAYLFARLVGPQILTAPARSHLAELRACEATPVFGRRDAGMPELPEPLPPLEKVVAGVEALRPGYLGVSYEEERGGARILDVRPGTPAARAGLRAGDLIRAVDGKKLAREGELMTRVALAGAGATIRLDVQRGDARREIPVKLDAMPVPPRPVRLGERVPSLGLTVPPGDPPLPPIGAGRPTILFFWMTTCGPCKRALPALHRWAARHNTHVIAVTSEPAADVAAFREKAAAAGRPFPFPVALDPDERAHRTFEVKATPVFVEIDGEGRLVDEGEGFDGRIPLRRGPD